MFIQTESTPNPATLKFLPGRAVLRGAVVEYRSAEEAQAGGSALAARLLGVDGVSGILFGADFISVTKGESVSWEEIRPSILMEIMEYYAFGGDVEDNRGEETAGEICHPSELDGPNGPIVAQILELLETRVRPAVARDGGDIVFHGFDKGIVYLKMRGACSGCPSSTATLKMGIENMLRHYVPEVTEVRPVREE